MKTSRVEFLILGLVSLSLPACGARQEPAEDAKQVTVTTLESRPVALTQQYVGQIRSHHRIEVRAPCRAISRPWRSARGSR